MGAERPEGVDVGAERPEGVDVGAEPERRAGACAALGRRAGAPDGRTRPYESRWEAGARRASGSLGVRSAIRYPTLSDDASLRARTLRTATTT